MAAGTAPERPGRAGLRTTTLPVGSCTDSRRRRPARASTYSRAAASFSEARGMAARAAKCFQTALGSRWSRVDIIGIMIAHWRGGMVPRPTVRHLKCATWKWKLGGWYCIRAPRSEEHTSELQSLRHLVCRLLLVKKN